MKLLQITMILLVFFLAVPGGLTADKPDPDLNGRVILKDQPDGKNIAVIREGAAVQEVGRSGEWVKVSISGWIPASDLPGAQVSNVKPSERQITSPDGLFISKNVSFRSGNVGTVCTGMIRNDTKEKYDVVTFSLRCMDANGKTLETAYFTINRFKKGTTRVFKKDLTYLNHFLVTDYEIEFESSM